MSSKQICLLFICVHLIVGLPWILAGHCSLPGHWQGSWFQSGVRVVITITSTELSTKGECMEDLHEKYIFRDKTKNCYRCVVISEKHPNILQYKESLCESQQNGDALCSLIAGDALLYSLFRRHVLPRPCPLKGPLTFSYNQGYGVCSVPFSTIDSCTTDSKLLFKYQACPDVIRTESLVEKVECIGHWKEGSTRYFVGRVESRRALTDEDQYRCFAWEKKHKGGRLEDPDYLMAQSGDASCNGVTSASDGSKTLKIKKVGNYTGCQYPWWITQHRHWHTLDHRLSYTISHNNSTIRLSNKHGQISDKDSSNSKGKMSCATIRGSTNHEASIVSHSTTGCESGYVCTVFHRRDHHIIEVQLGSRSLRAEDACSLPYFNSTQSSHLTLTGGSIGVNSCPLEGIWGVPNYSCAESVTHLRSGCGNNKHSMDFISKCDAKKITKSYLCHGSWKDGQWLYAIVSPAHQNTQKHCLVVSRSATKKPWDTNGYQIPSHLGNENDTLSVTVHSESCPRQVQYSSPSFAVNFSSHQSCMEFEVSSLSSCPHLDTLILFFALAETFQHCYHLR